MKHCCSVAGWLHFLLYSLDFTHSSKLLSPARQCLPTFLPHPCTPFAGMALLLPLAVFYSAKDAFFCSQNDNRSPSVCFCMCSSSCSSWLFSGEARKTHSHQQLQQQSGILAVLLAPLSHQVRATAFSSWYLICLDCIHPRSHPSVE